MLRKKMAENENHPRYYSRACSSNCSPDSGSFAAHNVAVVSLFFSICVSSVFQCTHSCLEK